MSDSFRKSTDILVKLAEHLGFRNFVWEVVVPYLNDESIPISEEATVHDK